MLRIVQAFKSFNDGTIVYADPANPTEEELAANFLYTAKQSLKGSAGFTARTSAESDAQVTIDNAAATAESDFA